jgi:hypothetical protein
MALGHRAFRNVTRDMVAQWLQDWQSLPQPKPTKRVYIGQQLEAIRAGLSNETLDVSERDDYPDDEVPLLQIIMDDLRSYA